MSACRPGEGGAGDRDCRSTLFLGRQPILNLRSETFAYELLFRSGESNEFVGADGTAATRSVISNAFLSLGLDRVMGRRKAFVNFPRDLLAADEGLHLPPGKVVIEVLEDVEPDEEVISACRRFKAQGYELALDDFVANPGCGPLVDIADFIKDRFSQFAAGILPGRRYGVRETWNPDAGRESRNPGGIR